jgi:DNA-binding transcriptional ArsR family regulator
MAKSHAHGAAFRSVLRLFALFGHPVRVVIFQRLARVPMTGSELAQSLPISRTAVVQHLKLLEAARLVDASPNGRKRVYRIRPKGLIPLERWTRLYLDEAMPDGHRTKILDRSR